MNISCEWNDYTCIASGDGEKLEIKVREGKITIEFEKGSTALYEKVKHLGESISETVGSKK